MRLRCLLARVAAGNGSKDSQKTEYRGYDESNVHSFQKKGIAVRGYLDFADVKGESSSTSPRLNAWPTNLIVPSVLEPIP